MTSWFSTIAIDISSGVISKKHWLRGSNTEIFKPVFRKRYVGGDDLIQSYTCAPTGSSKPICLFKLAQRVLDLFLEQLLARRHVVQALRPRCGRAPQSVAARRSASWDIRNMESSPLCSGLHFSEVNGKRGRWERCYQGDAEVAPV